MEKKVWTEPCPLCKGSGRVMHTRYKSELKCNETRNCLDCRYANWLSDVHGICEYPLPASVPKLNFRKGIYKKLLNEFYAIDYGSIGIEYEDGSIIKVVDCPCWAYKNS
jgi:hypothetical protein